MKIRFEKMSGAGNDFVVIDNRDGIVTDGSGFARRICDRHWGVGADGLLMLEKSSSAAYRMMYYNSDGSYGGMCGNGGRCVASYAFRAHIAPASHEFEALDHIYRAHVGSETVKLAMKDPTGIRTGLVLPVAGMHLEVSFINTGAPHVVVFVKKTRKGVEGVDVDGLGREIRGHRSFRPAGVNVNFVEIVGSKRLRIRTYERGVEEETLACGTGSVASAIVASRVMEMSPPIEVIPKSRRKLVVDFVVDKGDGAVRNVTLEGPAERVFDGEYEIA